MSFQSAENLIKNLEWRYAVKRFDATKKIPQNVWEAMEKALVLTPSSYGLQPWKFLVVESAEIRQKLKAVSWNQSQVTDASHYVVFCTKQSMTEADIGKFIELTAKERGTPLEKLAGYRDLMINNIVKGGQKNDVPNWNARQVYIALGNAMTAAAVLGVDTCPMEGLDPKQYDEILGLAGSDYRTVCALAYGYRSSEDVYANAKKIRYAPAEVIKHL
jgi:nitroreductase